MKVRVSVSFKMLTRQKRKQLFARPRPGEGLSSLRSEALRALGLRVLRARKRVLGKMMQNNAKNERKELGLGLGLPRFSCSHRGNCLTERGDQLRLSNRKNQMRQTSQQRIATETEAEKQASERNRF